MSKSWSRKYEACIECGTTEVKHNSRGLCVNCYTRKRRREAGAEYRKKCREYRKLPHVKKRIAEYDQRPETKKLRREISKRWRERNPEQWLKILANWRERNREKIKTYNARSDVRERRRKRYLRKKYGESASIVLERDNYECQKCGSKEAHIHHIDWDKENNNLDNLIVLCNSCHQKLHTFVPKRLRREIFEEWVLNKT